MSDKIYLPTKDQQDQLLSLIGKTNDTGGSASAGSVIGKLNKTITDITTANTKITNISTYSNNTMNRVGTSTDSASPTGTVHSKLNYIENTLIGTNSSGTMMSKLDTISSNVNTINSTTSSNNTNLNTLQTNVNKLLNKYSLIGSYYYCINSHNKLTPAEMSCTKVYWASSGSYNSTSTDGCAALKGRLGSQIISSSGAFGSGKIFKFNLFGARAEFVYNSTTRILNTEEIIIVKNGTPTTYELPFAVLFPTMNTRNVPISNIQLVSIVASFEVSVYA